MPELNALDLKAFVLARDFELAQHFYRTWAHAVRPDRGLVADLVKSFQLTSS